MSSRMKNSFQRVMLGPSKRGIMATYVNLEEPVVLDTKLYR